MALDGSFLSSIANAILNNFEDARVEKVNQPSKDCIIISLRHKNGNKKLLLSSGANGARIHFTNEVPENPPVPPMFCMLLRKHLTGGKLKNIRQVGRDRVLFLDFEVLNELADAVTVSLCIEIMGHNSNIILINENGVIIDAIKRVNADLSSVRVILPSAKYTLPPEQNKKDLFSVSKDEMIGDIKSFGDAPLHKALLNLYSGLSPIVCREFAYYCAKDIDVYISSLSEENYDKLFFFAGQIKNYIENPKPTAVYDQNKTPKDFSFFPIHQYGSFMLTREFADIDSLLDNFFSEKDRMERVKQKSGDLLKLLSNISERITRKLANQKSDLEKCKDKESLRQKGDIIYANLSAIEKGQSKVVLPDFYSENGGEIEISLDVKLTPAQNAQKYYNEYRKSDTAEKMLSSLIKSGEEELKYIDSVFDSLVRAASEAELSAIRAELYEGRYIKKKADKKQMKASIPYLKYRSSDGFLILCGRNNVQNDKLTTKDSSKGDIWFHTQKIPGSHTVIVTEGKEVSDTALLEAATIAAYNSKARSSSKVAVDYTIIKNVKKPSGAKPGMVIYDNYKTLIVDATNELVNELIEK